MNPAIGIAGYGLLGSACAARLRAAGRSVLAYDPDPDRRAEMGWDGVRFAPSAAALAEAGEEMLIAVFSAEQVDAVLTELIEADAGPLRVLCLATVSPADAAAADARAREAGIEFVELPISGSSRQVAAGDALALAGGERRAIEAARATIEAIAPRLVVVGPAGAAARAKLAINLVLELNRSALAEGLALAEALGLELDEFAAALLESSARSAVIEEKQAAMRAGDFTPAARVTQSLKDVRLMLELAAARGQQLPLAAQQAELLESCVERGWGELDGAVVIEELRHRRGAAMVATGADRG